MIVFLNCGYPPTDGSRTKGYGALKREVGVQPKKILDVSEARLTELMRRRGIVQDVRAERLKEIARKVKDEFGGALTAVCSNGWAKHNRKRALRQRRRCFRNSP